MEEFVYYNNLYDVYGDFLTDKQKEVFRLYYLENLSMQEIADILNVSKSYVGSAIKLVEKKLNDYENRLKIFKFKNQLKDLLLVNDISKIKNEIENIINE